ncbi:LBF_2804 family protein [Billgrantia kenyensis]|uniref:Uncharacterized protein n=1 Tax=Billgrantia kenyensis TaxID=321266 RepID=A0A7V9W0Q2_9GAMM|nr:hypothetical protein [Halomonas kenyensis]MBA2778923.1 hypothetical protein [Halomonas kenyensis]MCG6662850.1 hypothetical protein [Halomonas kenyensis]
MAEARPDREYAPQPSVLERWAARYLQQLNHHRTAPRRARHDHDLARLKRTFYAGVAWAALAGIVSGGMIGGMEWYMRQGMLGGMEDMSLREQLPYWAGFFAVAGVVSAVEIAFLYWNALRGVATTSRLAGAPMRDGPHARLVLLGLTRVALEFPSPRHRIYGIDPYARMSRWKINAIEIMYRMKVGVSSFLIRVLLRRVLGRVALRGVLPLLMGPLYAAWNAIITWRILVKAREQALGPFAIEGMVRQLRHDPLSERGQHVMLHTVGAMIMANQDAHPNHVYLLSRLIDAFEWKEKRIQVDWPQQRFTLNRLERGEKHRVLELQLAIAVLAGYPRGKRKRFLEELYEACNIPYPHMKARAWRQRFMDGQPLDGHVYHGHG